MNQVDKKLEELNIKVPDAPAPVGAYVAFKIVNNLIYISGQLPIDSDGKLIKGKIIHGLLGWIPLFAIIWCFKYKSILSDVLEKKGYIKQ